MFALSEYENHFYLVDKYITMREIIRNNFMQNFEINSSKNHKSIFWTTPNKLDFERTECHSAPPLLVSVH